LSPATYSANVASLNCRGGINYVLGKPANSKQT